VDSTTRIGRGGGGIPRAESPGSDQRVPSGEKLRGGLRGWRWRRRMGVVPGEHPSAWGWKIISEIGELRKLVWGGGEKKEI